MRYVIGFFMFAAIATGLCGPAFADGLPSGSLKKTVAVDTFLAADSVGGNVTGDGMTAMLIAALVKDGRFVVVERPTLASVQAEQTLGTSGATTSETAAKANQMIGANILIQGVVTKFEANANGGNVKAGNFPMGRFFGSAAGVKGNQSVMEISLRLIDAVTGQVIATVSGSGSAISGGADVSVTNPRTGAALDAGAFHNTPLGEAGEAAIDDAIAKLDAAAKTIPWSALVVDATEGKVYINAGQDRNVQPGLVLSVYRKGKVFIDPATNVVLDVDLEKIGTIRVDSVRAKLGVAVLVSGTVPARGDILELN